MSKALVIQKSGHVCGSACRNGTTATELAKSVAAAVERGIAAAVAKMPSVNNKGRRGPSLTEQVKQELARHRNSRLVCLVDERSGHVAAFMAPPTSFEQSARNLTVPSEQRDALERERKRLIQALPNMIWKDRVRAQQRIRQIERDLGVRRFNDESERRHRERSAERDRERYGA